MKHTVIFLFLIFIVSCSNSYECQNRFDFVNCSDSIPILDIKIDRHIDSLKNDLNKLYGYDLCKECRWIEFKMPFELENRMGFIKAMLNYENCEGCPIFIREKHSFFILFNRYNKLLVEGEPADIDSLNRSIYKYLSQVGKEDFAPNSFNKVNFTIRWYEDCKKEMLDSILTIITSTYINFVENELESSNQDFCSLDKESLMELKDVYPIRIEFSLEEEKIPKR